jgi:NAD(P)-dependent dehydrogenase (short-subunit alcohol dehydrogenase family)
MSEASSVAVVTGGTLGIGRAAARQLADRGWTVVITGRDQGRAVAAAAELNADVEGEVVGFGADVTDPAQVAVLGAFVRERFGRLDALVNNAGVVLEDGFPAALDTDIDTLRSTLEVNLIGALSVSSALVPLLLEAGGGNLVNVSSGMGGLAEMDGTFFAYRVSKTALNALTRVLHAEWADHGLRANSVCPGFVRTGISPMNAEAPLSPDEGAAGVVWAATLGEGGAAGGFFRHGEAIPW